MIVFFSFYYTLLGVFCSNGCLPLPLNRASRCSRTICNAIDRNGGTPYKKSGTRSKNTSKNAHPPCPPPGRIEYAKRRSAMKIGLALGSGSARGWSHIGIIEALAELDIHPEIVCDVHRFDCGRGVRHRKPWSAEAARVRADQTQYGVVLQFQHVHRWVCE